jgi:hypothetical protein
MGYPRTRDSREAQEGEGRSGFEFFNTASHVNVFVYSAKLRKGRRLRRLPRKRYVSTSFDSDFSPLFLLTYVSFTEGREGSQRGNHFLRTSSLKEYLLLTLFSKINQKEKEAKEVICPPLFLKISFLFR